MEFSQLRMTKKVYNYYCLVHALRNVQKKKKKKHEKIKFLIKLMPRLNVKGV